MKQRLAKFSFFFFLNLAFFSTVFFVSETQAGNPTLYTTIHNPYARTPENSKTYSFGLTVEAMNGGYMPYLRVFIPPGTLTFNLQIKEGASRRMTMSHHKMPPTTLLPQDYYSIPNRYTLAELEVGDCLSTESLQGVLSIARDSFLPPYLPLSRAGWLYVNVSGGSGAAVYYNYFSVEVDTKTYNAWWDKYIKDEAGWNKYIESVETYLDPTIVSPTPTFSPTFLLGDLNQDRTVNLFDYNLFLSEFGKTNPGNIADLNKSGKVDIFDYNIFLFNFGKMS